MAHPRLWMVSLTAIFMMAIGSLGAERPASAKKPSSIGGSASTSPLALAAKIDEHLATQWKAEKVQPAQLADDAEFLRRIHLDVIGHIPSVPEVRDFLEDKSPDKRQRVIENLLASPGYVRHFTNVWRRLMLPEADANFEARPLGLSFETWLRTRLAENAPYDQMVREILTVAMSPDMQRRAAAFEAEPGAKPTPISFYTAKEAKPENLAGSTARLFLGVRLECAQCHDHPFAKWKREQFWEFAAFFASLDRREQENVLTNVREVRERTELIIPGTEQVVQAGFLDGSEPQLKFKVSPRVTLADWVTSPENAYFARATANRLWGYFFGVGIVDPVDDMGAENPPSHPELLDELAREFAAHNFDLKFLIRAIAMSLAYQLTSATSQADPDRVGVGLESQARLFSRMAIKGLSPEQVFDSLAQATGYRESAPQNRQEAIFLGNAARNDFLAKFAEQGDKRTEVQTSILQALALMNGQMVADATSLERSETLAAVANAPFLDTAGQIETLFLATLSRKPQAKELARLVKHVETGATAGDRKKALADVFWVLLNSGEFILNH